VSAGTIIESLLFNHRRQSRSFKMRRMVSSDFMPVYAEPKARNLKPGGKFYLTVDGTRTQETFIWTANGDRTMVASLTTGGSFGSLPTGFSLGTELP